MEAGGERSVEEVLLVVADDDVAVAAAVGNGGGPVRFDALLLVELAVIEGGGGVGVENVRVDSFHLTGVSMLFALF